MLVGDHLFCVVNFINFAQFRYYITDIREMSYRNFEDCKKTLEELESFFFCTLFLRIPAFIYSLVLNYHDFFLFFFLLLVS
jgi:hypothetical protein